MSRFQLLRRHMVEEQLRARGIRDARVLSVMERIPRHLFVPEVFQDRAYEDHALVIGEGQTISQPFIVALMTEALGLSGEERVLEIGTGSGYQTAILAALSARVDSLERIDVLMEKARSVLERLHYSNVRMQSADGSMGWKAEAPFEAILVTAGAPEIPQSLIDQLADGGRLVIPVGDRTSQVLKKVTKTKMGVIETTLTGCVFVPLIGVEGWPEETPESNT